MKTYVSFLLFYKLASVYLVANTDLIGQIQSHLLKKFGWFKCSLERYYVKNKASDFTYQFSLYHLDYKETTIVSWHWLSARIVYKLTGY